MRRSASHHETPPAVGLPFGPRAACDSAEWLRRHDPLTRLPNRVHFDECVELLVDRCARSGDFAVVLALDLDRFQLVNESFGYPAGSLLLRRVGERLAAQAGPGELVARSCADEFLVLVGAATSREADDAVERFRAALAEPFLLGNEPLHVDASFGVCSYPDDAASADSLVHGALTALHQARRRLLRVCRFETSMCSESSERLSLARDLRFALERDQLQLVYQPQVDLRSGRVTGVEALVRWLHPERGWISPQVFVALAEQNGSIEQLTDRVLRRACHDVAALRRRHGGLRLAVNLSARELARDELVRRVRRCLEASHLEPSVLDLEITESTLMRDVDESAAALAELRRYGVRVSVDDFGTGYSSLSYLRRFELDILKIDRAFVDSIDAEDGDDGAIAELIVGLAAAIGARAVAEGVETEAQAEVLRRLGCDEAQGYLFSPPVPREQLETLLSTA